MNRMAMVLLRHESRAGVHFDWLLAPPPGGVLGGADPGRRLWTVRVASPSWTWRPGRCWHARLIGAHRRAFLSYQGSLTGDRGRVVRVDTGYHVPWLWTDHRIVTQIASHHCRGRVDMNRVGGDLWQVTLSP